MLFKEKFMSRITYTLFATFVTLATAAHVNASTIISDSFSTGTSILGRTPDVDLPGSTYVNHSSPNSISGGAALVGNNGEWDISLTSNGGYIKPTDFTVSAVLNLNGQTGHSGSSDITSVGAQGIPGGIVLGFVSIGAHNGTEFPNMLGVDYNDAGGGLLLIQPTGPSFTQEKVLAAVTTIGGNPIPLSGNHTLSYEVNTTTGNIFNVTFDNTSISFGAAGNGLFTDAATNYVGNYSRSGDGNVFGTLDDFLIATAPVPEPSSLLLLGLGATACIVRMARRRRV
jgi:hypothetical protein